MTRTPAMEPKARTPARVAPAPGVQTKAKARSADELEAVSASLNASPRVTQLERLRSTLSGVVQARFISQDFGDLTNPVENGGHYKLKIAGKPRGTKLDYPYLEYDYPEIDDADTKHAAMHEMQEAMVEIGEEAPQNSLTNTVVEASAKNQRKVEWTDPTDHAGYYPQNPNQYWPFAVAIGATYQHTSNLNMTPGDLAISAFFAPGKYGYITEVMSDDSAYDIDIDEDVDRQQLLVPDDEDGFFDDSFSSTHSTGGVRDLTQDAIHMEEADGADAATKVIAEGARWQSVAELSKKSLLTNTSKFYALTNDQGRAFHEDESPPYIEFQDLWLRWRDFGNQWDISADDLEAKLNDGTMNGTRTDQTLAELESDTHNLGVG